MLVSLINSLEITTPLHLLAHDVSVSIGQELLARLVHKDQPFLPITSIVFLNGGVFPSQHRALFVQKVLLNPFFGRLLPAILPVKFSYHNSLNKVFGSKKLDEKELYLYASLFYHQAPIGHIHQLQKYILERRQNAERWEKSLSEAAAVPICLINGPADPVSGRHLAEYFKKVVNNPDVILLADDVGHYPNLEAPEEVLKYFDKFHRKIGTY
ncbi:unnamed protein product [Didymodactylos carnosus]|uniref:Uncharacterized protein n=1 Tax=Didymodactylos carnosus TaxID=1234261 RepID=A0A814U2N9_9BILA|nr:unnamed protein product [Didymodactylos carnosus]CAF1168744.1 unnamed protein product [Didymodactylos carnosus]CAF3656620.1 unnamed protein product [Didymodactylos carnosus]CAF3932425.1 unnamed protein product [Didymodactylos carnosus]